MRDTIVKVPFESKWYGLDIHRPNGEVDEVEFPDMEDYDRLGPPYLDHAPNPRHVYRWALSKGYRIDPLSLELIIGRWEIEYGNSYADMFAEGDE